ncbi:MAG: phage tail tape measure protein, partial [Agrobacterium vaccinii]
MPTVTEQLVVSLEARIRDFERNFQRANRTANTNFQAIERQAKRSADTLEQSMSKASQGVNVAMAALKGGVAGIVAGLSIGALQGVVSRIGDVTKGIANIGSEAKRAGLSTRAFQELGYVAQQNRIPIDALTDGMKELSLRADEFIVTGQGSAAEAFQRLGFGADDLKRKLKDPSSLLVEIIAKLQQLDKAAQIRIADELFGGTGGERFVELIDRGADGMRKLIKEANDFGAVMDDEVIARADELDRKWNALGTT